MPCNSDYMNPTVRERQSREVAGLLVFLYGSLGIDVPGDIASANGSAYGAASESDASRHIGLLCKALKSLSPKQMENIVYDGHNRTSRRLADWWEEHQAEDAKRDAKGVRG